MSDVDTIAQQTCAVLAEELANLETLLVSAVLERADHPAIPTLRAAVRAVQDAFNAAEVARLHGWDAVPDRDQPT